MGTSRILRLASVIFLIAGLLAVPTVAAAGRGPATYEGNATCQDVNPDWVTIHKVDIGGKAPLSGNAAGVGWTVSDSDRGQVADWTSSVPVSAVLVKGQAGGSHYPYGGAHGGSGLHAQIDKSGDFADVDVVTFCGPPPPRKGALVIEKITEPRETTDTFSFDTSIRRFSPTLGSGDSATATDLRPGSYTVTELPTTNWELTDLTCDDGYAAIDIDAGTAVVDIDEGETVTCTFTNVREPEPPEPGTLTVEKITDPADDEVAFRFFSSVPRWRPVLGHGDSSTVEVEAGAYTLTEKAEHGWELTSITCDAETKVDLAGGSVTVDVPEGANVTCTFTNTRYCPTHGWVAVEKYTDPVDETVDFEFWSDIVDRSGVQFLPVLGHGESSYSMVDPGVYHLTELPTDGWDLANLVCDDPDTVIDLATGTATLDVSSSELVTCVFTNTMDEPDPGTLVIEKIADPDDSGTTFGFETTADGFAPILGHGEQASVTVDAGSYTVSEVATEGWELTALACDDPEAAIDLAAGTATVFVPEAETVTCVFTNTMDEPDPGTLVIEKVTDPDDTGTTFGFETTANGFNPTLGHGEQATATVDAGSYTVSELATEGWGLTALACDDPEAAIDLAAGTATVYVPEAETVTCVFTNTKEPDPGFLVIKKIIMPIDMDPVPFVFETTVDGFNPTVESGGSASATVDPGIYTMSELATEGWDLTALTCDDPDAVIDLAAATATVDIGENEYVTCVFTNTRRSEPDPGVIGDFVWDDKNLNGVQDPGEPGIAGVRINLYRVGEAAPAQISSHALAQDASGLVATRRTDANGHYVFEKVEPGEYIVEFTGLPEGFAFTKPFTGNNNELDSDAGQATGRTPVMVLPSGYVDLTCDAGAYAVIIQPPDKTLPRTGGDVELPIGLGIVAMVLGAALVLGVRLRREF